MDGFINKYVLCKQCKNPETDVTVKDGDIRLDCKACGQRSTVDVRLKLSSFILKQNKKGKKDKSTKKAERKAKKQAQNSENGENGQPSDEGSPDGSNNNSDHPEENGDVGNEAGSDDELTRKINAEAKQLHDVKDDGEIKWTVDVSEAAIKARAQQLPDDLKKSLAVNGNDEEENGDKENTPYNQLGTWLESEIESKGSVNKLDDVDIYKKAQELGIEKKHRTLTVLAQAMFDDSIVKEIDGHAGMLKKVCPSLFVYLLLTLTTPSLMT